MKILPRFQHAVDRIASKNNTEFSDVQKVILTKAFLEAMDCLKIFYAEKEFQKMELQIVENNQDDLADKVLTKLIQSGSIQFTTRQDLLSCTTVVRAEIVALVNEPDSNSKQELVSGRSEA
jgi:hypothetical protein